MKRIVCFLGTAEKPIYNPYAELNDLTSVKGGANLTATELEAITYLNTVIELCRPSLPRMKIIANKV